MAQLQGDEDALIPPVAVTQIPPDPQIPTRRNALRLKCHTI